MGNIDNELSQIPQRETKPSGHFISTIRMLYTMFYLLFTVTAYTFNHNF